MSAKPPPRSIGLWVGLGVGGPVIAFGIAGAINDSRQTHPAELARWIIGAAVVHDLVFAPMALATAGVLTRLSRGRSPTSLRWVLATSAVLVLFAWPFVRGYGRNSTVPSLLPRNYALGLAIYVATIWVAAIAIWLGKRARQRLWRPARDSRPTT